MSKKKPVISIIAAVAENLAIGKNNQLLWNIPEDLKRFRKITAGHVIIMGKNTYTSIGKALPKRTNIVVSNEKNFDAPGCLVADSFSRAINLAKKLETEEIFIIGGGQIYRQAINIADKLYLTLVQGKFAADTFFPEYPQFNRVIHRGKGKSGKLEYTFLELERGK